MDYKEYLTTHGLREDFVKRIFAVSFDDDKMTIPVFDADGNGLYNKYRHFSGEAKFSFDKGSHPALFCAHLAKKKEWLVYCEGEPDCMRLWQSGIPSVTGTSGVKTINKEMLSPIANKEVFLCLDNDKAGQDEVEKYCSLLLEVGCVIKIISLPNGTKDVCEFFASGKTKEDFENLMIEAKDLEEWKRDNLPEEFKIESTKELLTASIPTEKWLLDRVLPYEGFCFIAGPEACGKSFYTLGIAQSVAYGQPWLGQFKPIETGSVLFIDKENTRSRIQKRLKGLGFDDPSEKIWRIKYPEYFEIIDDKGEFSKFVLHIQQFVKERRVKLIIVDSFTDVMIGNENARDDTQRFFDAFKQLFPGVSILVLHHISKPQPGGAKTGGQLFRGSTNINAQIYSGFLVTPVPKTINEFVIEQIKAGDAPKLQKFKVNLVSMADEKIPGDSYVSLVKYEGVVEDADVKAIEAVEVIGLLVDENTEVFKEDIRIKCQERDIKERTMTTAIKTMIDAGRLDSRRSGIGNKKVYFRPISDEKHFYNSNNDDDD